MSEAEKRDTLEDELTTLKAKYIMELGGLNYEPGSTQEERQNLKQKFDDEREATVRSATDNNVSLHNINTSDNIDPASLNEAERGAVEYQKEVERWKVINETCGGDVQLYESRVNERIASNRSTDSTAFISEDIQDAIDESRAQQPQVQQPQAQQPQVQQPQAQQPQVQQPQVQQTESHPQETEQQKTERDARQHQDMIRETDEYLANQQQSEPMDTIDPDG